MKVAMPTFGDRVSPRFDCATAFLVITLDQGIVTKRQQIDAKDWAPNERINHLVALHVDVVVCGGIDRWSAASLRSVGVALVGRIAGTIDGVLAALLQGELTPDATRADGGSCLGMGCGRGVQDNSDSLGGQGRRGNGRGRRGRRRGPTDPPRD